MSSYSFSHQFYQRWTCAPEPIRAAITQELKDIATLLQTQTPFDSFVFSTPDLDAHVDELYKNHEAEQAIAKALANNQTQTQAQSQTQTDDEPLPETQTHQVASDTPETSETSEKTKVRDETPAHTQTQVPQTKALQKTLKTSADTVDKDANPQTTEPSDKKEVSENEAVNQEKINKDARSEDTTTTETAAAETVTTDTLSPIKTSHDSPKAVSLTLKSDHSTTEHQALLRELETQIDDYLSEQMMLMSENLKSWLQAELAQRLHNKK